MNDAACSESLAHNALRRRLIDDRFLHEGGAALPGGAPVLTEAQLAQSLERVLAGRSPQEDVHVFGIGSLMWNPAIDAAGACVASVQGWHRSFCFRSLLGRGSVERPGVMLALDRGGSCQGMLIRIAAAKAPLELRLLWRREMALGSYEARWVGAWADGRRVAALAFVANRRCERYVGRMPLDELAHLVRTGEGVRGSTRAYFDETCASLARLGIRDAGIERLRDAVLRADRAAPQPARDAAG
ncbi:gamma-glutamylcyclotransferase [Caldimonas sp. KR1-144]|uniref:gamma-glutamylcyclotransferase n=1 Tax=Caldimonas sp. KR1-144 TaxID=3400911 RepID=UPI003C0D846D